jgi:hypothetical protein
MRKGPLHGGPFFFHMRVMLVTLVTPVLHRLVVTAALSAILLSSCTPSEKDGQGDPGVFKAATAALDKRLTAVRDYTFEGTARHVETGAAMPITYAFLQPQFARGTIDIPATDPAGAPSKGQTVVFDGTTIVALDHAAKTFGRVDNSVDADVFLLALHNAFAEFACEGWRPPLLKKEGTSARAHEGTWILTVAIKDETLKEEQLVLRASDGAFVEKRTLDKAGKVVASTTVVEELDDPATGLKLPKKWRRVSPAGTFEVELAKATVNAGIVKEAFTTAVPEGYKQGT